jgi:nitroimidazol reductase NimA-like FMN-containing flavoprotein (pyridoxamine 5'-phosphate oxidase superfamily)
MPLEEMLKAFDALRFGVLATSDKGKPYTSLIAFALTPNRRTLIFATPKATSKYENMISEPAVSILLDNRSQEAEDVHRAQAVTLLGTAKDVIIDAQKAEYRTLLLERHPELAAFIDEPGTSLIAVTLQQAVHVANFQNVSRWSSPV